MAAPKRELKYTTIRAPRGLRVHAVSICEPTKTVCGKAFEGLPWKISIARLNCRNCKLAIFQDCRPRRGRR